MKLVLGAFSYLAVVAALVVAAFAGLSSVDRSQPADPVALIRPADDMSARSERVGVAAAVDPDRVPVWIVPTAKYDYTPVPIEAKTRPGPMIAQDARAAMAKGRDASREDGRRAIERALGETGRGGRALGFNSSRDNDPFYRD